MPVLSTTPPDDPLEFAGYDLIHPLGKGGMGVVWSVLKRGPYEGARALAMKLLLPELSDDAQYQETFISEGRISMMLGSANIVPVYELGKRDGLLFMLMERVDGVNLSEFQGRTRNVARSSLRSMWRMNILSMIGQLESFIATSNRPISWSRQRGT